MFSPVKLPWDELVKVLLSEVMWIESGRAGKWRWIR